MTHARRFSGGSSDRIEIGTWVPAHRDEITIGCWHYGFSFSPGRDDRLIAKADGTGEANHDWMLGSTDSSGRKIRCRFNRVGATLVGTTTLQTRRWHLCAATFIRAGGIAELFLNGLSDGIITGWGGGADDWNTANQIFVGNAPTSTTNAPDGLIAHAFVIGRKLTLAEFRDLANGMHPRMLGRYLAWYSALDAPGRVLDASGQARHSTSITGTRLYGLAPPVEPFRRKRSVVYGASVVAPSVPLDANDEWFIREPQSAPLTVSVWG